MRIKKRGQGCLDCCQLENYIKSLPADSLDAIDLEVMREYPKHPSDGPISIGRGCVAVVRDYGVREISYSDSECNILVKASKGLFIYVTIGDKEEQQSAWVRFVDEDLRWLVGGK